MDWRGQKVLVTGAAGFIGSHLVEELIGLGARVTAFVRYTSRASVGFLASLTGELQIVAGDLTEFESVYQAMKDQAYVFHLGALIGVPYSFVHPREVVQVNTVGTLNVLSAARETKPRRVILTSTSEVYGTARYVPIDEDHPLHFGTATTFDAVDTGPAYVGGVIAPGIGISAEALFRRASRLPRIEIHKPEAAVGTSTVSSMQSGLYYGYIGLVDGIIERMKSELGEARVIATGGLAPLISAESSHIRKVEKNLTLLGLREFHFQQFTKDK